MSEIFKQIQSVEGEKNDVVDKLELDDLLSLSTELTKKTEQNPPLWRRLKQTGTLTEEQQQTKTESQGEGGPQKEYSEVAAVIGKLGDQIDNLSQEAELLQYAIDNPTRSVPTGKVEKRLTPEQLEATDDPSLLKRYFKRRKILQLREEQPVYKDELLSFEDLQDLKSALKSVQEELVALENQKAKLRAYIYSPEELEELTRVEKALQQKEVEQKDLEQYFENGEVLLHYEGTWDSWIPHPQGVVIWKNNQLLLNGTYLLYEGKWDSWIPHPQGVVIRKNNQLLLNGTYLLYEGTWDSWIPHPQGFVIRKKNQLLLNGTDLLYEGKWNRWIPHPQGVVIWKNNQLLLNGTHLLYEGEWDSWASHPQGVVIRKKNQLLLNGTDLLYEGKWDSWASHPQGVVIWKNNQLLLNGTHLLYEGKWDSWASHPQGVVIQYGKDWILYRKKQAKPVEQETDRR